MCAQNLFLIASQSENYIW